MSAAENRKLLVTALRSGKYQQGYHALEMVHFDDDGNEVHEFCCLGVACRVAADNGVPVNPLALSEPDAETKDHVVSFNGETGVLPEVVREWYGFTTPEADFSASYGTTSLILANDYHRLTFEEIAEFIEAEPAGLFETAETAA